MRRATFICTILILAIIFYSHASLAEDTTENIIPEIKDKTRILYLTLNNVLGIAIINNFDIQLAKYDRAISETDIDDELSIYDTVLKLEAEYTHDKLETSSTLAGNLAEDYEVGLNLSKKLKTGTDVDIDYNFLRHRTDSTFVQMNPSEESYLKFTFTQPLLKNILGINDWADVRITKIEVDNFASETLDKIENSLAETEIAYWELLLVEEMNAIRKEAEEKAQQFYEIVKEKEELGSSELTDLYAAGANLKIRKAELAFGGSNLETAGNKLKLLMNNKDAGRSMRILPADALDILPEDISLVPALKAAFENRRDYKRAMNDIKAKDIKLMMKKNERWPQLDLTGSFTMNGVKRSLAGSIEETFSEENFEYYAGVTFSFPLEAREEKSAQKKAELEKAKALVTLKKIEKTIVSEVDSKVKAVNAYRQRVNEFSEAARLQKLKLQEEVKKYRYGRSDSDRLTRFQTDYLTAELSLRLAMRDYMGALVDLYLNQNLYLAKRDLIAP